MSVKDTDSPGGVFTAAPNARTLRGGLKMVPELREPQFLARRHRQEEWSRKSDTNQEKRKPRYVLGISNTFFARTVGEAVVARPHGVLPAGLRKISLVRLEL